MGKTLVVAEKESVGQDLAKVLPGTFVKAGGALESDDHVVTWAIGHLVGLAEPDVYVIEKRAAEAGESPASRRKPRWRMADLPILPAEFKLMPADERATRQLDVVLTQMRRPDVDRVVNACDAGREGELIFAYIRQMAGVDRPVDRLWISSLTRKAIEDGFRALRPGADMARLEEAARSRAEADWLVGMNATRAATIKGRSALGGVVSLGRVQTPTLALIARREDEIRAFVPVDYWVVDATFGVAGGAEYEGSWFSGKHVRVDSAERAQAIVANVRGGSGVVASVERKEESEAPPLLYDLTSLQRDANRRFSFPAAKTLRIAQSLYQDKKALTYPRTSSRYLPSDMVDQLKPTAETLAPIAEYARGARYVLGLDLLPLARVVDDAKIGDHHAIIPTLVPHTDDRLDADERRVFDLVARRFLAVFHPPARYARTTVVTDVQGETFRTRGRVTLEIGWRGVYEALADDAPRQPDEEDEPQRGELPPLQQDQSVSCLRVESDQRATRPPPRYTEATLLSAMETAGKLVADEASREAMKDGGLGTPATRAETIETLIRREYVERIGKDLTPTPKGMQVIALLGPHPLTSPELTGAWEKRLNEIAEGSADRPRFMAGIADLTRQTVEQIAALETGDMRPARVELGPCPRCGAQTGSIIRENSKAYGCTSWKSKEEPGCGFVIWKKLAGRTLTPEIARQLIEQRRTDEVLGGFRSKAGKQFRARLLLDAEDKVAFDMPPRPARDPAETDATGAPDDDAAPGDTGPADGTSMHVEAPARAAVAATVEAAPIARPVPSDMSMADDADPAEHLGRAGLEVIDKRPSGSLWVVDGDPPSPVLASVLARGIGFIFSSKGGRATKHRPGWYLRPGDRTA